mmetsp:Transcript_4841/g.14550  ORF Transcript_4841/g.14550 Transcript_4841/m.14550 type:complete len:603 (-) Transcript_4841:22-1830(-)
MHRKVRMVYELFTKAAKNRRREEVQQSAKKGTDVGAAAAAAADGGTPNIDGATTLEARAMADRELVRELLGPGLDVPRAMMKLLLCFSDYSALPLSAPQVSCLFRTLYALYMHQAPHAEAMRKEVFRFVMKTALRYTRFIPSVIGLGQCVHAVAPDCETLHDGRSLHFAILEQLRQAMLHLSDAQLLASFDDYLFLLGALAAEPSIDPSTYLHRLHELLRASNVCTEGDWEFGMALLQFSRKLMLGQPTTAILESLGSLLSVLWTSFNDLDIRDHARFYYILLTHISGEQLSYILENNFESVARINDIMTDNLRLTSVVQLARPVQPIAELFLGFRRPLVPDLPPEPTPGPLSSVETEAGMADAYLASFPRDSLCARVPLRFGFTAPAGGGIPDLLFAVSITFGANARQQLVEQIDLPVLDVKEHSLDEQLPEGGGVAIALELCPVDPVPTMLTAAVEYSVIDGDAYSGPLEPLQISFRDMIVPLPIGADEDLSAMFHAVWASLDHEIKENGAGAGTEAIETVIVIPTLTRAALHTKFGGLVVREAACSLDGHGLTFEVGGVLLPKTHLLLRGVNEDGVCTIRVIAQTFRAVPFLQAYLEGA